MAFVLDPLMGTLGPEADNLSFLLLMTSTITSNDYYDASAPNSEVAGDDFKSGQTKMKSVLVDFLVSAGIKPTSIVSYNHLGNNDGKNLSAPQTFHSKVPATGGRLSVLRAVY